jgi:hypothetical protein
MTSTTLTIGKTTLSILKNFSSVNSNLLIRPGNKIGTISPGKNMMAETTVEEEFPVEFGIWDLNKFLGIVSLFDNPSFDFQEKFVEVEEAGSKVKFFYSEPKLLTVPTRSVKMPDILTTFIIGQDTFAEMLKASSVLQLPQISFVGDGHYITAKLHDRDDSTSNTYTVDIGVSDEEFEATMDMEHLRLLSGDYEISISKGPVAQFRNMAIDLKYWIALKSN